MSMMVVSSTARLVLLAVEDPVKPLSVIVSPAFSETLGSSETYMAHLEQLTPRSGWRIDFVNQTPFVADKMTPPAEPVRKVSAFTPFVAEVAAGARSIALMEPVVTEDVEEVLTTIDGITYVALTRGAASPVLLTNPFSSSTLSSKEVAAGISAAFTVKTNVPLTTFQEAVAGVPK